MSSNWVLWVNVGETERYVEDRLLHVLVNQSVIIGRSYVNRTKRKISDVLLINWL